MHNYIEYFNLPLWLILALMIVFGVMQGIGEFLEFKGKVVPEIMKVRKRVARRKREKEAQRKLPDFLDKYESTLQEVVTTLSDTRDLYKDIQSHYSADNIAKRDGWMQGVNMKFDDLYARQEERDARDIQMNEKMDKNNEITLALLIDNKRNYILDFTSKAVDLSYPLTKEQYQRFFNVHKEYEEIIEENNMVNGQVDVAYDVVSKSFEERLKRHAFIEDTHGYVSN